jgi:hypothetical protein
MKETIISNQHQLTSYVRVLDGKIGRFEVDVKGLQVQHFCFWLLSQIKRP